MDTIKKLNIISLGGISRNAIEILNNKFSYNDIYIYDDSTKLQGYKNIVVKGTLSDLKNLKFGNLYFNGIGRFDLFRKRIELSKLLQNNGLFGYSIIHESTTISPSATIGNGVFFSSKVSIGFSSFIGNDCVIFANSGIEHESVIGKLVYISPGVTICGKVKIGDYSYIGPGAVITAGIKIGERCIIGAGSLILKDIPDKSVAYGSPAKIVKLNNLW
jgi:sugar O-acyltransferase (sialic acid O-acetyltransferase NeuD family)